jgi:hypoxanthine-DNA glycosylase
MTEIIRNRTIRPSSRQSGTSPYKIDTKGVKRGDKLVVNINHETTDFFESYTFNGSDVDSKNSISFTAIDYGSRIDISWSGAQPIGLPGRNKNVAKKNQRSKSIQKYRLPFRFFAVAKNEDGQIFGLEPIADSKSKVLILGTMPGEESLKKQEYYGNPGNLFWKLTGEITGKEFTSNYSEKVDQLLLFGIALWDVCNTCVREGSLDSNIENETPNELEYFLEEYPSIKLIAFNGKEAAKLFGKHFGSIKGIKLMVLPSSSGANAGIPFETKITEWNKLKSYLSI